MKRAVVMIFLRNICALLLVLISCSTLAQQKLVFATHTRPPLSLYLKEVIQEAFKPYFIEIEVIEMAGSRVIAQVNNGQVDGDISRVINFKSVADHDTTNYRLVNESIVETELIMITLAQKEIVQPITWESINQGRVRVAYLRGSKTIRNNLDIHNRVALNSNNQVLQMVANKRVDSAIMFKSVAKHLISQATELNEILTIHKPSIVSFSLYTYLNKKHAGLIPKLESSLRELKTRGFLEEVATKYQVTAATNITQ